MAWSSPRGVDDTWWKIDSTKWTEDQTEECIAQITASLIPALEGPGLKWINDRLTSKAVAAYQRLVQAGTTTVLLSDADLNA